MYDEKRKAREEKEKLEKKEERKNKAKEVAAFMEYAKNKGLDEDLVLKYAGYIPTTSGVAKNCEAYKRQTDTIVMNKSKILRNDNGTVSFVNKDLNKTKINKVTIIECSGDYFDADMSLMNAFKPYLVDDNFNHEFKAYEVEDIEKVIKKGKRWVNEKFYCPETKRNLKNFMDCNESYKTKEYKNWIKTGICDNFDGMILDILNTMRKYSTVTYNFKGFFADFEEEDITMIPTGAHKGFCYDEFIFERFGTLLLKRSDIFKMELSLNPLEISDAAARRFEYKYEMV